ncbi:MAG: PEP-CTERM sorting domain-containing protein [Proteobacteria bacterium]|nr:PEP-CTERM sorting domain-containing protein [Pseudomonadota bacterium]
MTRRQLAARDTRSADVGKSSVLSAAAAAAPQIDNSTPIPDARVLLNFGGSGLDWVYAGPIAPEEFGQFNIAPASYRAAEGWRAATAAEWAAHPDWDDFIVAGNPCNIAGPQNSYFNPACYLSAVEYWSDTFNHVDMGDFAMGNVTDGVNNASPGNVYETIYVRNGRNAVPLPGTLALVGLGLIGAGALRRKA